MTTKSALTAPTLIIVGMAVSLAAGSSARADIAYDCPDRFGRTQTYITSGSPVCPDQSRVIAVKDTSNAYPTKSSNPMQPKIRIDYDYSKNWSQHSQNLIPIVNDTMSKIYSTYLPSIITKQHPTYAPIKSSEPRVQPVLTNVIYTNLPREVYPTVPQLQPTMTPVGYPHAPTISYPRPYFNIDTNYSPQW
ncbi:MAG: hypothetical protein GKR83_01770 [Synechococcus sp. s2_metabat2_7]|nr:hypothetical protein [Synechococcus sp. s2_metabat2_7]